MTASYRPVRVRPRTGEQSNGHQTYFIGVPWQIAEAISDDTLFMPSIDGKTGTLTFTPTSEPDPLASAAELGRLRIALERQTAALLRIERVCGWDDHDGNAAVEIAREALRG